MQEKKILLWPEQIAEQNKLMDFFIDEVSQGMCDRILKKDVICKIFPEYQDYPDEFFERLYQIDKRIKIAINSTSKNFKSTFFKPILEKLNDLFIFCAAEFEDSQNKSIECQIIIDTQQLSPVTLNENSEQTDLQKTNEGQSMPSNDQEEVSTEKMEDNPPKENDIQNPMKLVSNSDDDIDTQIEKNPSVMSIEAISEQQEALMTQAETISELQEVLEPKSESHHAPQESIPVQVSSNPSPLVSEIKVQPIVNQSTPGGRSHRIPNAKVGVEYQFQFSPEFLDLESKLFKEMDLFFDPELGLHFDKENFLIHGTPLKAGEFVSNMSIKLNAVNFQRPSELTRQLLLTINPDPRSLWNHISSDQNSKYWKPDKDKKRVQIPENKLQILLAASQRGRSHAHVGSCRDDDFLVEQLDSNSFLLITADGAGSAKYSRQGSKIACEIAAQFIRNKLLEPDFKTHLQGQIRAYIQSENSSTHHKPPYDLQKQMYELLPQAALNARKAIEKEAESQNNEEHAIVSKDFATTIQICLAHHIEDKWFFSVFAIGDGATAVYSSEYGGIHLLTEPDSGEYSGQTRFLTMSSVWSDASSIFNRLKYLLIPDFTACFVMTDGVSDPKFVSDQAMQTSENWDKLWQDLIPCLKQSEPDQAVLEWLNFWSEGEHDDRTIAVLTGASSC